MSGSAVAVGVAAVETVVAAVETDVAAAEVAVVVVAAFVTRLSSSATFSREVGPFRWQRLPIRDQDLRLLLWHLKISGKKISNKILIKTES